MTKCDPYSDKKTFMETDTGRLIIRRPGINVQMPDPRNKPTDFER